MNQPNIDFDFLSWLQLTAFFPGDLRRTLQELDFDIGVISTWLTSEAVRKADVIQLYRDYGRNSYPEFQKFIAHHRAIYDAITSINSLTP